MTSSVQFTDAHIFRAIALSITLIAHASLLLLADRRERPPRSEATLNVSFHAAGAPPQREVMQPPHVEHRTRPTSSARAVAPSLDMDEELSVSHSAPQVDWQSEGEAAAQSAIDSLIRAEGYRALGPRGPAPFVDPEPPPTIFDEPKHTYGDSEKDPLDYDRVWHSANCFTELGKPLTPRVDARIGNVNPMKCMRPIGKKPPRGDLFDHLKKERPRTEE